MIWHRLIYAIGTMATAWIISQLSLAAANKLEKTGKFIFIVKFLAVIYYFSSLASLFFGLYSHFAQEETNILISRIDELTSSHQNAMDANSHLTEKIQQLQEQLRSEQSRTDQRSYESGRKNGYVNGYSVGFEDCMDVLGFDQLQKTALLHMSRRSGIHRIKSRPSIFDSQKAIEDDGILK